MVTGAGFVPRLGIDPSGVGPAAVGLSYDVSESVMSSRRAESAKIYRDGDRPELAANEEAEIEIIKNFLPAQLSTNEMTEAIAAAIAETGAESIKDMGQVMGYLKTHYAGQMDFSSASQDVKAALLVK